MPEAPPKMPSFPRGCGWTLIAFGVPCLIVGLISIAAVPVVLQRSKEIWTETPATIVETFVERGEWRGEKSGYLKNKRSVGVTFNVMLRYDYEVDGKTHQGVSKCLEMSRTTDRPRSLRPRRRDHGALSARKGDSGLSAPCET